MRAVTRPPEKTPFATTRRSKIWKIAELKAREITYSSNIHYPDLEVFFGVLSTKYDVDRTITNLSKLFSSMYGNHIGEYIYPTSPFFISISKHAKK